MGAPPPIIKWSNFKPSSAEMTSRMPSAFSAQPNIATTIAIRIACSNLPATTDHSPTHSRIIVNTVTPQNQGGSCPY